MNLRARRKIIMVLCSTIISIVAIYLIGQKLIHKLFYYHCLPRRTMSEFEGFDNITGVERPIIPNIVHYIFASPRKEMSFIEAVCILSAFKNQKPRRIYVHTDLERIDGWYWEQMMTISQFRLTVELVKVTMPKEIFGQKLNGPFWAYHATDVMRIKVLQQYGGIYMDTDTFVVRRLDRLLKYEMVVGVKKRRAMGTQVLLAHPDARFLRFWYDTYRRYDAEEWYWNAGEKPTRDVLFVRPELFHNEPEKLGVENEGLVTHLMNEKLNIRQYVYTIHLLRRWMTEITENNFKRYKGQVKNMILDVVSQYQQILMNKTILN